MELYEYWLAVVSRLITYPHEREAQAACNVLDEVRPDLADEIWGTVLDPFYLEKAEGIKWDNFVAFLKQEW